jgi:hypothetical protein
MKPFPSNTTRSKPTLVYFWIAELDDGDLVPEYDPITGLKNRGNPDWLPSAPGQPEISKDPIWEQHQVVKLTWHPFSPGFAELVRMMSEQPCRATTNPSYFETYNSFDTPLLYRTHDVKYQMKSLKVVGRTTSYMIGKLIDGNRVLREIREDGSYECVTLTSGHDVHPLPAQRQEMAG